MGNQLIKDTHIEKDSIGNGGIGSQWEMHSGHRLDKNKAPVTIFLFEKKNIGRSSNKDDSLALIKKESQSLARFKHPNILSLVEPLIEDQKSMGFVTEATKGSLQTLIHAGRVGEIFPTELDTKFHLLEIAETLSFLHNDVKSCHLSLSPENIYTMNEEKWKLGGFPFTTQILQGGLTETPIDFKRYGDLRLFPSVKFTAPEVANNPSKCSFSSDIFSFGCLIYTLYKIHQDKNTNNPYLMNISSHQDIAEAARSIQRQNLSCIPEAIRPTVVKMLNPDPTKRITISEFLNLPWFKDPFIQTVKHLETLYQRELPKQQVFLKGIGQIVLKFEKKFLLSKIIPLLNTLIKNEQLAASILPIYFQLIDHELTPILSKEEFLSFIWPSIKALTTGKGIPAQALYLLIQNSHLILDITDMKEIQTVFVPLLIKSYECGVPKLQILALQKTEGLFKKIEYNVSKNQILPRVLNLCLDQNISLRKEAIVLLSKIHTVLDKSVINDQVLATLEKVRKLSNNYKINMTLLSIFEGISKNLGMDMMANKILISMIPMLVDQSLSKSEYKAYLSTVKTYLNKIEEEQNKFYQGMPDHPPNEEAEEDVIQQKKAPKPDLKSAGAEFAFLDVFNEGGMSQQKMNELQSSGGIGDFDFSAFDDQFSGMGKSTPTTSFGTSGSSDFQSTSSGWQNQPPISTYQNPSADMKPKMQPLVVKSQQQQQQKSQGFTVTNTSGTGGAKGLKSLGDPFANKQQNNSNNNNLNSINFGTQQNSNTNQNMFANMKMNNQNQNTAGGFNNMGGGGGQNKWDILDNEVGSFNNPPPQNNNVNNFSGMNNNNNNQSSNQFSGMNMNMNAAPAYNPGFSNNNNNNNNQFQYNPNMNNSSTSGWDDLDKDFAGFGNSSTPSVGGFNKNPATTTNFGNQNFSNQAKPSFQPNPVGQFGANPAKNAFQSSDDFFSSFDVQKPSFQTNTFGGSRPQGTYNNNNSNDLI